MAKLLKFLLGCMFTFYHWLRELLEQPEPARSPVKYVVRQWSDDQWIALSRDEGGVDTIEFGSLSKAYTALQQERRKVAASPGADPLVNGIAFRIEALGDEVRFGEGAIVLVTRPSWKGGMQWWSVPRNLLGDIYHDRLVRKGRRPPIGGKVTIFSSQYYNGSEWQIFEEQGAAQAALASAKTLRKWARTPNLDFFQDDKQKLEREKRKIPPAAHKLHSFRVTCKNEEPLQAVIYNLSKPRKEEAIFRIALVGSLALAVYFYLGSPALKGVGSGQSYQTANNPQKDAQQTAMTRAEVKAFVDRAFPYTFAGKTLSADAITKPLVEKAIAGTALDHCVLSMLSDTTNTLISMQGVATDFDKEREEKARFERHSQRCVENVGVSEMALSADERTFLMKRASIAVRDAKRGNKPIETVDLTSSLAVVENSLQPDKQLTYYADEIDKYLKNPYLSESSFPIRRGVFRSQQSLLSGNDQLYAHDIGVALMRHPQSKVKIILQHWPVINDGIRSNRREEDFPKDLLSEYTKVLAMEGVAVDRITTELVAMREVNREFDSSVIFVVRPN